ncbi:MAG: polyprenyl diphosphate synthase [Bryobacterales bacterium]|nr:polyprenyl diphosphate synthase [Bryobacterales bacterium]
MRETARSPDEGLHVGLIMDGNGRWAEARGLQRTEGHGRGADAVRRAVEAAPSLGITTLTLYAFSADNWRRPASEVSALMGLLESFLVRERANCCQRGVRLGLIGRRDRLSPALVREIEAAEHATRKGTRLYLRLAVDYSGRSAILAAAAALRSDEHCDESGFLRRVNHACHSDLETPQVDLIIRTSGEQRLSDFLLFESAYAELMFVETLWPDFDGEDLRRAVEAFRCRERRYGGLTPSNGNTGGESTADRYQPSRARDFDLASVRNRARAVQARSGDFED